MESQVGLLDLISQFVAKVHGHGFVIRNGANLVLAHVFLQKLYFLLKIRIPAMLHLICTQEILRSNLIDF